MARFRKSIKLAPGIKINLSKSGISTTFGAKGASVNVGKNGIYANTGIPGTGIYDRKRLDSGAQDKAGIESGESAEGESIENEGGAGAAAAGPLAIFGGFLILGGIVFLFGYLVMDSFWLKKVIAAAIVISGLFLCVKGVKADSKKLEKIIDESALKETAGEAEPIQAEAAPVIAKRIVKNKQTPGMDKSIYTIEYADYEGKETRRDIEINSFLEENGKISLYAYCYLRNEARQFVVDRIKSISIKGGDPIDNPQQFLRNKFQKQAAEPV